MCLSIALWQNGGSEPDAVWHGRSDGSRNEACSGVWEEVILGANMGRFTGGNPHCAAVRLLLAEFLELQARRAGELSTRCG